MKTTFFCTLAISVIFFLFLPCVFCQHSPQQHFLFGPTSWVRSVAFSPDGTTLVSGGWDKIIWLWHLVEGAQPKTLHGHTGKIYTVIFSPDGKTLASGGGDNTIRLWNAATGKQLKTLRGHTARVWSIEYSPDGKTIASGSWDTTIRIWDATSGMPLKTLSGHTHNVLSVAFSPDGRTLASAGGKVDKTIRLWNVEKGKHLQTLTGHRSFAENIVFSPDGRTLASGGDDGMVGLWALTPSPNTFMSISPTHIQTKEIGEKLTFKLNISGGHAVAAYTATVAFDPTVLRYIGSKSEYLPDGAFFGKPIVSKDRVTLASQSLSGVGNVNFTLASLTFEAISAKPTALKLYNVILSDSVGRSLHSRIEDDR